MIRGGPDQQRLRDALERAAGGDDDARERSRLVIRRAYAGYVPRARRRPWTALAVAAALMPVAAGGVAAASAPESGVGRWVRGVLGVGARDAQPVLGRIPGGGRILVEAGDAAWVVSADGAKRRLGAYGGTSWSPRGLFAVGWRSRELTALDPAGRVRWSLRTAGPVTAARWAPIDGYRIAYIAGPGLRIVNGDGTGDHAYAAPVRSAVAPAWQPGGAHVLAYVDAGDRVNLAAVDFHRRLWRSRRLPVATELAWSPGADRLLVVTRTRLIVLDGAGRQLAARPVPAGLVTTAVAWSPNGREVAVVRRQPPANRSELVLADLAGGLGERLLLTGQGSFGAPAWSPDGSRLLLPWPDADQWLFLSPGGRAPVFAVGNVARQFAPGATRAAFPRSAQWCCAP